MDSPPHAGPRGAGCDRDSGRGARSPGGRWSRHGLRVQGLHVLATGSRRRGPAAAARGRAGGLLTPLLPAELRGTPLALRREAFPEIGPRSDATVHLLEIPAVEAP